MKVHFPEEHFEEFRGKVYTPSDDSYLLVDALLDELPFIQTTLRPKYCLEIGSGSGIVITSIAKMLKENGTQPEIFATDINEHAIRATKVCLDIYNIEGVKVVHTNLVDGVKEQLYKKCDLLVTNPPFEPSALEEVQDSSVKCAWAAGTIGRSIIDKIMPELPDLMSEKGVVYMTVVVDNDIPDIIEQMKGLGFKHHKIVKRKELGRTSSNFNRVYDQHVIRFARNLN